MNDKKNEEKQIVDAEEVAMEKPSVDTADISADAVADETQKTPEGAEEQTEERSDTAEDDVAADVDPQTPVDTVDETAEEQVEEISAADSEQTSEDSEEDFPAPESFDLTPDEVPTDDEERHEDDDMPIEFVDTPPAYDDALHDLEPDITPAPKAKPAGGHGRHGAVEPEHVKKAKRSRVFLIVLIVVLIVASMAVAVVALKGFNFSQQTAAERTATTSTDVDQTKEVISDTKDASTATAKRDSVPALLSFLGKTQDEVVAGLGKGAVVTGTNDVNEEGNPTKKRVSVTLTEATYDTKAGAPVVYLNLDEAGKVVSAGYSSATASLGYGTLSFADAVSVEHIIEKVISEAGLTLSTGAVVLPAEDQYTTYAGDGKTITKEAATFSGKASANQIEYSWDAVLTYDYAAANASGSLADTIRRIYVNVGV